MSTQRPWLLCDFHIHTHWSDGALSLRDTIDLYGRHGFDAIAITDHIVNEQDLHAFQAPDGTYIGILLKQDFNAYIQAIKIEAKRAWENYQMLVIPGAEFTNNTGGFHLLGLDIEHYLDPGEPIETIISHIHSQQGLAIAAHPVRGYMEQNTSMTYLWENRSWLASSIDAWEMANRFDLYDEVAQSQLPFIGSSDFHEPAHLYSWKTMLGCNKNVEAVKQAILENKNVAVRYLKDQKICSAKI